MTAKFYFPIGLLILLLIPAFWWGEAGGGIDAMMPASIVAIIVSSIVFFTRLKLALKIFIFLFLSASLVGAFLAGQASNGRAFNECLEHGEDARTLLQGYFQSHQNYPASLSAFNKVPCNRILHSSILNYQLTKRGYQLYFGDSFVSFTATESQPFEAHK